MSEIVLRTAATIVTVRDAADGPEVLMLRRNLNSDFVGGAYVFPGGGLDASDESPALISRVRSLTPAAATERLGCDGALSFYLAGLRELFEEAGVLLATHADGSPLDRHNEAFLTRVADARRALNAGTTTFADVLAAEDLVLDLGGVAYMAHWVTPVGPPRRYDTRFFLAAVSPEQAASCDEAETIADVWIRPADALAAHAAGEFEMIFPTIRTLERLVPFASAADMLAWATAVPVRMVQPRLEKRGETMVIVTDDEEFVPAADPTTMKPQSSKELP